MEHLSTILFTATSAILFRSIVSSFASIFRIKMIEDYLNVLNPYILSAVNCLQLFHCAPSNIILCRFNRQNVNLLRGRPRPIQRENNKKTCVQYDSYSKILHFEFSPHRFCRFLGDKIPRPHRRRCAKNWLNPKTVPSYSYVNDSAVSNA